MTYQITLDHTPAPWVIDNKSDYGKHDICQKQVGNIHVIAHTSTPTEGCQTANAKLMASSPQLLKAFNLTHKFLDSLPHGWMAKTTGDIGALNDLLVLSREINENLKGA